MRNKHIIGTMNELEAGIVLRIKQSMKTRGVTQQNLAEAVGVKQCSISRMLSGTPFPTVTQLVAIASRLDVSLYYLLGVQEESYRELSPEAAKIADAYQNANETVRVIVERILLP